MKGPSKHILAAAIVTAVASIGTAGCGSSDSSSSTASAPLTKAAFLKAGNQICQKRLKEKDDILSEVMSEVPSSEAGNPSADTLNRLGESILPPVRKIASELSELSGSAESEAAAEKITRELEAGLKKAEADPTVLTRSDPFAKANAAGKAYGFETCIF